MEKSSGSKYSPSFLLKKLYSDELSLFTIDLLKSGDKMYMFVRFIDAKCITVYFFSTFAHFIKKNKWNISYLH